MDEFTQTQISEYLALAKKMGDAARAAAGRGDAGMARTAARQAAQYARLVVQLETGEKQIGPEELEAQTGPTV